MIIVIIAIIAFGTGIVVGLVINYNHPVGDLRVDHSDPTSAPYLFLELDTDVHNVMHKKHVVFRVKLEDFLPRE